MVDYDKAVIKALKEVGATIVRRGKGDHTIWESPLSGARFPVDGKIVSRHTANQVMKQAGIDKKF